MSYHVPVLLYETIDLLNLKSGSVVVDGTVGGGGHSEKILDKIDKNGLLIGIDQDQEAVDFCKFKFKSCKNVRIFRGNFLGISNLLNTINITKVDSILLDLGVSSHQLDTGSRGFSYHLDGPLDMRMDKTLDLTGFHVVNNYSAEKLEKIFLKFGEEPLAKKISRDIIKARTVKSILTTGELSEVIKQSFPPCRRFAGKHPARKIFQAIRIEVNNELGVLETLETVLDVLKAGGRLAIITFHSLEDRIVKNKFLDYSRDCICPSWFPVCKCDTRPKVKLITKKPIVPSAEELLNNKRCRSAKLRVVERL